MRFYIIITFGVILFPKGTSASNSEHGEVRFTRDLGGEGMSNKEDENKENVHLLNG
jgi:hypothetical protein